MTVASYSYQFSFTHVPPLMKRGRHALIVVKDEDGNYILGAKDIYPEGIVRFVGGGLDENEDPIAGAARELEEELRVQVASNGLTHIATIQAEVDEQTSGKHFTFTTYLFSIQCNSGSLKPADDLDGIQVLTVAQMLELVKRYRTLPSDLITVSHPKHAKAGKEEIFRWSDYGKLYGEIHQIGFDLTSIH